MSQIKTLYRLQTVDLEIEARLGRVREIETLLANDEELQAAQSAVDALQGKLRPQETRVNDLNLKIQSVDGEAQQLSQRLYSGSVSNPKELGEIQDKIAERQRRHAQLEEDLLETMIIIEELQISLGEANTLLDTVRTRRAEANSALTGEHAQLEAAVVQLKTDRKAILRTIEGEYRTLYKELRVKKGGRAVSALRDSSCSVCGVGQTTQVVEQARQGDILLFCSSCGRILVVP